MKRLTLAAGVAICAATLAAGTVFAKPGGHRAPINFEQLDTDGDGSIPRSEMENLRAEKMASLDADGDGNISLEELEASGAERVKAHAKRMMDRLDKNDDGVISADEMGGSDRASRRFDRVDTDGDGVVTKAEFEAAGNHKSKRRRNAD